MVPQSSERRSGESMSNAPGGRVSWPQPQNRKVKVARFSTAVQLIRTGNLRIELHNRRRGAQRHLYRRPLPERGNWSVRRINSLHTALPHLQNYLEIGLAKGRTFEHVTLPNRVGVDPNPQFNVDSLPARTSVFVATSDEFFASVSDTFDVVFLDGLHTYQQTYRDLLAALGVTPTGVILVDDVVPSDEASALPDEAVSLATRRRLGLPGKKWHGDVFRMVMCLVDHHPELAFRTIVGSGNEQLLVWQEEPGNDSVPVDTDVLDQYAAFSFDDVFGGGVPASFLPTHESVALTDAVKILSRR